MLAHPNIRQPSLSERGSGALNGNQAVRLARALRALRETKWPDARADPAQLQGAQLGRPGGRSNFELVGVTDKSKNASVSQNHRLCPVFLYGTIIEGEPHLYPEDELTPAEKETVPRARNKAPRAFYPEDRKVRRSFLFDSGPVIVICPTAPTEFRVHWRMNKIRTSLGLRQYGDLDALIELYGHLSAENPNLEVFHRPTRDAVKRTISLVT